MLSIAEFFKPHKLALAPAGTQSAGPTETRLWLDTVRSLKKESFDQV